MNAAPTVSAEEPGEDRTDEAGTAVSNVPSRPDSVPDKFWNHDSGCVNTDALLKSYCELESKLGRNANTPPGSGDDYEITLDHPAVDIDPDVNARLHAAGFSQDQAQLVYDLAVEKLLPVLREASSSVSRDTQIAHLENTFGGPESWKHTSRQIESWARANLPDDIVDALSSHYDGVVTLHKMMTSNEPAIVGKNNGRSPGLSEADLRQMMQDPRYWRDNQPSYVSQVRAGFEALYPG